MLKTIAAGIVAASLFAVPAFAATATAPANAGPNAKAAATTNVKAAKKATKAKAVKKTKVKAVKSTRRVFDKGRFTPEARDGKPSVKHRKQVKQVKGAAPAKTVAVGKRT